RLLAEIRQEVPGFGRADHGGRAEVPGRGAPRRVPARGAHVRRDGCGSETPALLDPRKGMTLAVVTSAHDFRRACQEARGDGELALVPTMGYLHAGHQSLIKNAAQRAPAVAVTIFVNPTQFGTGDDLSRYPRDIDGDLRKCEQAGATFAFVPRGP